MDPRTHQPDKATHHARFLDRDHSWLEFNRRVLHKAIDQPPRLLERLTFLAIFTSNLDECFMKRVGLLHRNLLQRDRINGLGTRNRLRTIREILQPMLAEQAHCCAEEFRPQLAGQRVHLLEWHDLSEDERHAANAYFRRNVYPALTPQGVG